LVEPQDHHRRYIHARSVALRERKQSCGGHSGGGGCIIIIILMMNNKMQIDGGQDEKPFGTSGTHRAYNSWTSNTNIYYVSPPTPIFAHGETVCMRVCVYLCTMNILISRGRKPETSSARPTTSSHNEQRRARENLLRTPGFPRGDENA